MWTPCSAPAAALYPWNRCGAAGRKLVEVKEFFRICWDIFILSGNMLDVFVWNTWLIFNVIPVGTCKSLLFFFNNTLLKE
jgi:hypothetical protein